MHICPAFHTPPKATEAGVLLREYLLTETNSFMQHLQDEILHQQEFLLAVLIKRILSFVLFMLLTFCKSSQKLPCCILMQPNSHQECRISVTEPHHPCTNKLIIWFSDYQIHSSLSHVKLPHFSFLPLSVCVCVSPFFYNYCFSLLLCPQR